MRNFYRGCGIGGNLWPIPGKDSEHFTGKVSSSVQNKIASMGLIRVAGNAFVCPSSKDFWKISGDKIIKITVDEVDNGEQLAPAPSDNPGAFLLQIMDDLTL